MADDSMALGYALGQDSNDRRNDGMFGEGGWIFLILIFALMGGNGFGGFGGNALTRADLCDGFNFNNIENGVRGIQNGLCDGFYAQNTTMLQGFNGVGSAIANLGYQAQQCCCETNRNIDAVRYENAKNTCDIIQNAHNDADRIINVMAQDRFEAMRDRAVLAESQIARDAQTRYLENTLRPCPMPAYITCNPWATQSNCSCL